MTYVPPRLRVVRICRPKYGCRACGTIHQAPVPERQSARLASPGLPETLHARQAANIFASSKLFADDTTILVLDPGRCRTGLAVLGLRAR